MPPRCRRRRVSPSYAFAIVIAVGVHSFQPSPIAPLGRRRHGFALRPPTVLARRLDATPAKEAAGRNKGAPSRDGPSKSKGKKRRRPGGRRRHDQRQEQLQNPEDLETWRLYGIDVAPDELGPLPRDKRKKKAAEADGIPSERSYLTKPVLDALLRRLRIGPGSADERADEGEHGKGRKLPPQLEDALVVRRSVDARRRRGTDPKYTYVIDVTLARRNARDCRLKHQPGRCERTSDKEAKAKATSNTDFDGVSNDDGPKPRVIIVGGGPAGLFCALSLASSGLVAPVVLERGQPVEARGRSIGALMHRRLLDPESNFSFGEGGAGSWSDGKLTTRIGRNSGPVRMVLETLVKYGAPERILVEGAPHLGTDNLVRLLRNMRKDLIAMGGEVHFGACANKFRIEDGVITGVDASCSPESERSTTNAAVDESSAKTFFGDAVVLATGHSARDVYYELHKSGVELEAKGFAVGFRIEHPQALINEIQYGKDWGGRVFTGRSSTDTANKEHFTHEASHSGTLPVASYRLATNEAFDGDSNRGAYSFCQCPGGQIVPSSTEEGELCINGMSFSNRDSQWANSALVVTVSPDDLVLEPYRAAHGVLAGLEFQRDMERKAYELGGGGMRAPAQRVTDYVNRTVSESIPLSSYRLGVTSAPCHEIYPMPLYGALSNALVEHFDKQMPGFLCDDAVLHGVETRTSSPVRVSRDAETLQASGIDNLFPAGEGAGFAGGIVSAAVDGLLVAGAITSKLCSQRDTSIFGAGDSVSVGFDY